MKVQAIFFEEYCGIYLNGVLHQKNHLERLDIFLLIRDLVIKGSPLESYTDYWVDSFSDWGAMGLDFPEYFNDAARVMSWGLV